MSLKGLDVIVTRPRESADATVRALNAAGATAVALPLLEISALEAAKVPLASPPDAIIFVSSHAAEYGVPELSRQRMIANAAAPQEVYAVGRATASRLAALGLVHVSTPASGEDSEALLAEPTFASPAGRSILIVKGASGGGGRQLLEDTLVQRGAIVYSLVCYRRELRQQSGTGRAFVGRRGAYVGAAPACGGSGNDGRGAPCLGGVSGRQQTGGNPFHSTGLGCIDCAHTVE